MILMLLYQLDGLLVSDSYVICVNTPKSYVIIVIFLFFYLRRKTQPFYLFITFLPSSFFSFSIYQ